MNAVIKPLNMYGGGYNQCGVNNMIDEIMSKATELCDINLPPKDFKELPVIISGD